MTGIYYLKAVNGNEAKLGWLYIGQALNIEDRIYRHFRELTKNEHCNERLQRYFNKYGENSFQIGMLLECEKKDLDSWEIYAIDLFNTRKMGFNLALGGRTGGGGNLRKCKMQNMFTDKIVEFDSVKEFADYYGVNRSAASQVMGGKNNYVGHWFCPDNAWRPKKYEVISPWGEKFVVTNPLYQKFCKKYNIKNPDTFLKLLEGKYKESQGWKSIKGDFITHGKIYKLISPDGEVFEGKNVQIFAISKGLNPLGLRKVVSKARKSYKGWRLCQA